MTSMFVNEGGVAGHMSHLYDNPALTFKQMKKYSSQPPRANLREQRRLMVRTFTFLIL